MRAVGEKMDSRLRGNDKKPARGRRYMPAGEWYMGAYGEDHLSTCGGKVPPAV